jgi:hypothetical protein
MSLELRIASHVDRGSRFNDRWGCAHALWS